MKSIITDKLNKLNKIEPIANKFMDNQEMMEQFYCIFEDEPSEEEYVNHACKRPDYLVKPTYPQEIPCKENDKRMKNKIIACAVSAILGVVFFFVGFIKLILTSGDEGGMIAALGIYCAIAVIVLLISMSRQKKSFQKLKAEYQKQYDAAVQQEKENEQIMKKYEQKCVEAKAEYYSMLETIKNAKKENEDCVRKINEIMGDERLQSEYYEYIDEVISFWKELDEEELDLYDNYTVIDAFEVIRNVHLECARDRWEKERQRIEEEEKWRRQAEIQEEVRLKKLAEEREKSRRRSRLY